MTYESLLHPKSQCTIFCCPWLKGWRQCHFTRAKSCCWLKWLHNATVALLIMAQKSFGCCTYLHYHVGPRWAPCSWCWLHEPCYQGPFVQYLNRIHKCSVTITIQFTSHVARNHLIVYWCCQSWQIHKRSFTYNGLTCHHQYFTRELHCDAKYVYHRLYVLFGIKPLPEPVLNCYQLEPKEQTSVKFESTYSTFYSKMLLTMSSAKSTPVFSQNSIP